jgi:hypothetical protein
MDSPDNESGGSPVPINKKMSYVKQQEEMAKQQQMQNNSSRPVIPPSPPPPPNYQVNQTQSFPQSQIPQQSTPVNNNNNKNNINNPVQQLQTSKITPENKELINKSNFNLIKQHFGSSGDTTDSQKIKYSILVILIFVLLNSKLIWKQICKLPFMGSIEPSILALVFNSLLSGLMFFLIVKFVI